MGIVRLHITPLSLDTLPPPTESPRGRSSYCVCIFLRNPFLPREELEYLDCERGVAEGIKEKLNGSLFRGVKARVEDTRPDTFVPGGAGSGVEGEKEKRKRAKGDADGDRKKAKNSREKGVVDGIGL